MSTRYCFYFDFGGVVGPITLSSNLVAESIMNVQNTISEIARTTTEQKTQKRGAPEGAGNKAKRAKVKNKW